MFNNNQENTDVVMLQTSWDLRVLIFGTEALVMIYNENILKIRGPHLHSVLAL